jgi:hypothetical protein
VGDYKREPTNKNNIPTKTSVRVTGGALSDLETLWRVTTYVPEEGDNLVHRALERVKTYLVSALHYVYDFVRAGGCVTV